jgi:glycosyltransferase involved in cell wall biosynthesis
MKICYISPFPPERDGIGEYLAFFVSELIQLDRKCEICVIARKLSETPKVTARSPVNDVSVLRSWSMRTPLSSLMSIFLIIKNVIKEKPDVVHFQYATIRQYGGSVGEPFLFILAALKFILKVKIVLSIHTFWTLDEAELLFREITGNGLLSKIYKYYYFFFVRLLLSLPDCIISIVLDFHSPITANISRIAVRKDVVEIPHGIPTPRYSIDRIKAKKRLGLENNFVILLFGFIMKLKGYEHALRGVRYVTSRIPSYKSKIKILIAGSTISADGRKYLRQLKKLTSELGLEANVSFEVRYLDDLDAATYICAADVILATYSRPGGPSGVFSLATSYGTPTIVSTDGKYITTMSQLPAVILKNTDHHNIANAIEKLMVGKENSQQKKQMKAYKDKCSLAKIAELHLIHAYKKCIYS